MRTALITVDAPEAFIELADAKLHLRVETTDDDDLIGALVAAVCGQLDGPDGVLKRAVGEQTLKLVLPSFSQAHLRHNRARNARHPYGIELPLPPAAEIEAIAYFDSTNTTQTLDADAYSLIDCGTSNSFLMPAFGTCWPPTVWRPDAVSITYSAGFADIPGQIVAAAKLMLGDLYQNREATVFAAGAALENPAVKALLAPWRVLNL